LTNSLCHLYDKKPGALISYTSFPAFIFLISSMNRNNWAATLHNAFMAYCEREGFEPNLSYKSLMPNLTVEMISYGLCIGLLPLPIIRKYMTEDVVTVPL